MLKLGVHHEESRRPIVIEVNLLQKFRHDGLIYANNPVRCLSGSPRSVEFRILWRLHDVTKSSLPTNHLSGVVRQNLIRVNRVVTADLVPAGECVLGTSR
jgi:hypothetical protein